MNNTRRPVPNQNAQPPQPKKSSGSGKSLVIVGVLALIILLGVGGYFFAYPLIKERFFPPPPPPVVIEEIQEPEPEPEFIVEEIPEPIVETPKITDSAPKGFYIIVGSFRLKRNADKFVKIISRDLDAESFYFASIDMHRVSVGFYNSWTAACNDLPSIRDIEGCEKAWVLINKY